MAALVILAPLFLLFEVWQLVVCERYLGIKQIARNGDPRALGLGEVPAFFWSLTLFFYWAWMAGLLLVPYARLPGLCLLAITGLGYAFRRNSGLKWILVILTFEGALRIGLLVSLSFMAWRRW